MRLLHAKTKKLEDFFGKETPPYAILSHTWVTNEVTFADIERNGYKFGSAKIDGCCQQALAEKLEYIWIDTCCIDKSSSAELSEAINSMWSWYSAAEVCYAYLSDVPEGDEFEKEGSAFRRSRWFTRGWTLQELIAPRTVYFYNESWRFLGRKGGATEDKSLTTIVSQITMIPSDFLNHKKKLSFACVAQKMSWAAGRTTTRKEDRAYSLLGIFNINMPLLYGEGEKAFKRLQLELVNESNEHTIFAWSASAGVPYPKNDGNGLGLLAPSPDNFTNCGDVRRYYSPSSSQHHTTNIGLSITLPIVLAPELGSGNLYLAILDCYREDANLGWDHDSLVSIYLSSEGNSKCSRVALGEKLLNRRQRSWAQRTQIFITLERSAGLSSTSASKPGIPIKESSSQSFWPGKSSVVKRSQNGISIGNLGDELANSNEATGTPLVARLTESHTNYFYRFYVHSQLWRRLAIRTLCGSWKALVPYSIYVQVGFYSLAIIAGEMHWDPLTVFILNSAAIVMLSRMFSTLEDTLRYELGRRSLLTSISPPSVGYGIQILIIVAALKKGEVQIVQTSILGSIMFDILLVLGCCLLASGIRHTEHKFNSQAASIMSSIMAPALVSLVIPATFCASLQYAVLKSDEKILIFSRGAATMILMLSSLLALYDRRWFAYFFGVDQYQLRNISRGVRGLSYTLAYISALSGFVTSVWLCAVYLIDSIDLIIDKAHVGKNFIGFILLPIIGRAGHLALSIRLAYTHSMDIAIPTVLLNCLYIAFFVLPLTVIYGWINDQDITLHFQNLETLVLFVSVLLVSSLVREESSKYVSGAMCVAIYGMMVLAFYLY